LCRVLRPQPRVLLAQLLRQPRQPRIRLQRRSQHLPQRRLSILRIRDNTGCNHHAAQQTPSAAADHALRTACLQTTADTTGRPPPPRNFRILTFSHMRVSDRTHNVWFSSSPKSRGASHGPYVCRGSRHGRLITRLQRSEAASARVRASAGADHPACQDLTRSRLIPHEWSNLTFSSARGRVDGPGG
jgi:hypothetical protein